MEYTTNFAEPNKTYKFRVCQYMTTTNGGAVCGAWSVVKTAVTMLSPHGEIYFVLDSIPY